MAAAPQDPGAFTPQPRTTTPANKYAGLGTQLLLSSGGTTPTFTVVPSIKTLGGPKTDSTQIDTTTLDAVGGYETFVMGLLKPGTLSFELVWDPGHPIHTQIRTAFASRTLCDWQIIWPDSATTSGPTQMAFSAFVKSWEPKAAPNTDLTKSVELQISGPITESLVGSLMTADDGFKAAA